MSFKTLVTIFISFCILKSNAADTCIFDFSIPNVGLSCEMKGGLPSALIDKYEVLHGRVQGLKLVIDDKKGLKKIIQDEVSKIQREQQIYSQNINQISNDIRAVKQMLPIQHVGPKITKLAADPYKALRDALNIAELKLANMTKNMEETARRHSMEFSMMEQRVLQQNTRLASTLTKIADLEKRAAKLPGIPQRSTGGVTAASFNTVWNIATISAKIQATTAIIKARVNDLNERLREMDKPIQKRNRNYQILDNNAKRLESGVLKLTADATSLNMEYMKFKNDQTQKLIPVQSDMTKARQNYKKLTSDEQYVVSQIQNGTATQNQNMQDLKNTSASLSQLKTMITNLDHELKNRTNDIKNMKKDPIVQLAQLLSFEVSAKAQMDKDIAQAKRLKKTIDLFINNLNSKVASYTASG